MQPNIIPLEAIQIAKPCRADWNHMTGDQRARFCGSCHKNVYDISQMTRDDAQNLIQEKEGNVCIRLYRRPDGTVITSDCPVGQREVMKPMWWTLAGFVALLASAAAVRSQPADNAPTTVAPKTSLVDKARRLPIVGAVVNQIAPQPRVTMGDMAAPTLGRIAVPVPVPSPTPTPTPTPTTQPTDAPLMGKPSINHALTTPVAPAIEPMSQPLMGEPMPICVKK